MCLISLIYIVNCRLHLCLLPGLHFARQLAAEWEENWTGSRYSDVQVLFALEQALHLRALFIQFRSVLCFGQRLDDRGSELYSE